MSYDVVTVRRYNDGRFFASWASSCPAAYPDADRANEDPNSVWAEPNAIYIMFDGIGNIIFDIDKEKFLTQDPDSGEVSLLDNETCNYFRLDPIGERLKKLFNSGVPTLGEIAD